MKPDDNNLYALRHSLAHITAAAVKRLWPEAKFGVGPVVEHGYYYDIDLGGDQTISEADFPAIEKVMRGIIQQDQPFEHFTLPIDEAITWAEEQKQPYKKELLHDLQRAGTTMAKELDTEELGRATTEESKVEEVSFYRNGDFTDLCRGPHVASTGEVGAFRLQKVAGAYWRGKEINPQMQRLYGLAFATQAELDDYLKALEEAKARDHRKLGAEMGIFMMSETVGAGLPLWMPAGEQIKHTLAEYMRQKEELQGYKYVSTPVLAHEALFQRSGHVTYYSDDMYSLVDDEQNRFYLKAMNCPHHHMIYEKLVKSYRDLPLRLAEPGTIYRKELSGTLTGLIRVRGAITQNDAHIYVTPDQLKDEFIKVLQLFKEVYDQLGITDYWYRLSLPDFGKDKYGGDEQVWRQASQFIREALDEFGASYVEAEGEAAFYGPKLDVQTRNVLGKEDSIATSQVDVLVPKRMGLTYIDDKGEEQTPLIIHRAILGSYERAIGFLLEKTAGWLPFWLAPEQVRILTINDAVLEYAQQVKKIVDGVVLSQPLKYNELRSTIDDRNESLGRKIRDAVEMKVPLQIIVGPRDAAERQVSVRLRSGERTVKLDELSEFLHEVD